MHEHFASYMETTLQLATNQGVVLPPRSTATKSILTNVRRTTRISCTYYCVRLCAWFVQSGGRTLGR